MMGTVVTPRQPLPVGFRFQPTDKEVFNYYLKHRNTGVKFRADVPDIEMTKLDPWKLPVQFKDELSYQGNDNDWWFFSPRNRDENAIRITESGKWKDNVGKNKIMDRDTDQIMGIRIDFTFLYREVSGQCTRIANWKLYEYRLTDDRLMGLRLPDKKTCFVLCHLCNKCDETNNKTGMNGKISSQKRQRKRTMESMEAPPGTVDPDFTLAYSEQQRHRQDNFLSSYQPQSSENPCNVQQFVEVSWANSSGSGSSGLVDFNGDIPSNSLEDQTAFLSDEEQWQTGTFLPSISLEDQTALLSDEEQWQTRTFLPSISLEDQTALLSDEEQWQRGMFLPCNSLEDQTALLSDEEQWQTEMFLQSDLVMQAPRFSPHVSLQHQGGLSGDASSSSQQNIHILGNRRTQSTKSLRGVVPAEEKKTVVKNRLARPLPSPPLSPNMVEEPTGSKASNSPSSSGSFIKLEARVIKKEPTAANPHKKEIGVAKIEEDEELAQETTKKLRLKSGPILINQNQNSLSSRFKCSVNVAVGLVLAILICYEMLHAGSILLALMLLIWLLMKSGLGSTL